MIISSWNIRGLNSPLKQNGVLNHARRNKVDIMGILETKLSKQSLEDIARRKFRSWRVKDNFLLNPNGRILILWKEDKVQLQIIETTDQGYGHTKWHLAHAKFDLPGKLSDHSPCTVSLFGENDEESAHSIFSTCGPSMKNFQKLSVEFGECSLKAQPCTEAAEEELSKAQQQLHDNPADPNFQRLVPELRQKALKLAEAELSYFSQLAKSKFLKNCDKGTKFFHDLIKSNRVKNHIASISLEDRSRTSSKKQVGEAFVQYYRRLLGTKNECTRLSRDTILQGKLLDPNQADCLIRPISDEEIKAALFSIGEDKAPGPGGFSSCFYKSSWDIIARDFTAAIKEIFSSGELLKQINHAVLALIPKSKNADRVEEFKPIACCNVIYKVISKLIVTRLVGVLPSIIDPAQAAFVQKKSMKYNIFLLQELLRQYGRKRSSPRCILNVDLRKAFDTLDWDFVQDMLSALQFPPKFIEWIMTCISSTSYSISYIMGRCMDCLKAIEALGREIPFPPTFLLYALKTFQEAWGGSRKIPTLTFIRNVEV
ncbi:hypothetical protein Acr_07g0012600 [Actinidia rufa]|uniref:Reverse transcriptase domain-containing protein n=1 Tax=Actinidia rufa TaxID=165716 RepID=A0A7J0EX60_9ERIC|nr:hypothetical protein Acr_07g0012600 [Actinidia rufa]